MSSSLQLLSERKTMWKHTWKRFLFERAYLKLCKKKFLLEITIITCLLPPEAFPRSPSEENISKTYDCEYCSPITNRSTEQKENHELFQNISHAPKMSKLLMWIKVNDALPPITTIAPSPSSPVLLPNIPPSFFPLCAQPSSQPAALAVPLCSSITACNIWFSRFPQRQWVSRWYTDDKVLFS